MTLVLSSGSVSIPAEPRRKGLADGLRGMKAQGRLSIHGFPCGVSSNSASWMSFRPRPPPPEAGLGAESLTVPLVITTVAIVAVGVILPYSPRAGVLGFEPLPAGYFLFLTAATLTYLVLVELAKRYLLGDARKYRHRVPIATLKLEMATDQGHRGNP